MYDIDKSNLYKNYAKDGNFMLFTFNQIRFSPHFHFVFPVKIVPLYSMFTGMGHETRNTPGYNWHGLERGNHEFTIWQYTLAGCGRLEYEGKEYRLTPGTSMITHVPHDHRYFFHKDDVSWEFVFISMNGREVIRLWNDFEERCGPVVTHSENSKSLKCALKIFEMAQGGNINTPFATSALSYEFMMSLFEDFVKGPKGSPEEPLFMKAVIEFCIENLEKNINVDDMAEISGFSRFHFCRIFTKYQGKPPSVFLKNMRLRHSLRMLQTELLTIKEIALKSGFQEASYFCKVFRKEFGVSPEEYRKSSNRKEY